MKGITIECALFTRDEINAYKIRQKIETIGVQVTYINNYENLAVFALKNNQAIIIVDAKSTRITSVIEQIAKDYLDKSLCFIYLNDNDNKIKTSENELTFLTCYDDILKIMPIAISRVLLHNKNKNTMSEDFLDKYLALMLGALKIPQKHCGYKLLVACIKLLMGNKDKEYLILKEVYSKVGLKFDKDISNVEKSIRFSIEKAKSEYPSLYECIFKGEKVSNSVFINFAIDKIKKVHQFYLDSINE